RVALGSRSTRVRHVCHSGHANEDSHLRRHSMSELLESERKTRKRSSDLADLNTDQAAQQDSFEGNLGREERTELRQEKIVSRQPYNVPPCSRREDRGSYYDRLPAAGCAFVV